MTASIKPPLQPPPKMFTHQPTTVAAREYIIVNYAPYTKAVHALGGYNTFILVVAGFIEGQSHVGASGLRVLTQIITSTKMGKRVVGARRGVQLEYMSGFF